MRQLPPRLNCLGTVAVTKAGLFFPPVAIQEAFRELVEPAAGTSGLLLKALEYRQDPLLVNPPFSVENGD